MAKKLPEKIEWTVLGRVIGTASAWDQADTFILQLYDFEPASGVKLPSGCVAFDFEWGTAESFDDDGQTLQSVDLPSAIAHLPVNKGQK